MKLKERESLWSCSGQYLLLSFTRSLCPAELMTDRKFNLPELTWCVSDADGRRVFSLVGRRIRDVCKGQFTLIKFVKTCQLIELVSSLLFEKVFVVEVGPRQDTSSYGRWIVRPVSVRIRHYWHGVWNKLAELFPQWRNDVRPRIRMINFFGNLFKKLDW